MPVWDSYPASYREDEVRAIAKAVQAGECISLVGLSGAGKSNLLGFLAFRVKSFSNGSYRMVDCNRLSEISVPAFLRLARQSLGDDEAVIDELAALDVLIGRQAAASSGLCLLLDRFDLLANLDEPMLSSNLRALRDAHKYSLTYVIATRRSLDPGSELAELFYGNTLWLGPLSAGNAHWTVQHFADRKGLSWNEVVIKRLIELSGGYPSFLRAACEAHAGGAALDLAALQAHPALQKRLAEFWADAPGPEALRLSGLEGNLLLQAGLASESGGAAETGDLTAKEHLLLEYFRAHPNQVCEKDNLIRAVWPEDRAFLEGLRDDSLAQLVRRLRKKIELDPGDPRHIQTIPGRGYRYKE
jgi:energy-coupling factor transporter ATP-binding protein EcfA2